MGSGLFRLEAALIRLSYGCFVDDRKPSVDTHDRHDLAALRAEGEDLPRERVELELVADDKEREHLLGRRNFRLKLAVTILSTLSEDAVGERRVELVAVDAVLGSHAADERLEMIRRRIFFDLGSCHFVLQRQRAL